MKLTPLSIVLSLLLPVSTLARTSPNPTEAKPQEAVATATTSLNLGMTSDYRYRGISQTRLQPALQGGIDYADEPSGWYLGGWASTIQWIKDSPGAGNTALEIDVYGGKKTQLTEELSYDLGALAYYYHDNQLVSAGSANANTLELYAALNYGPASLKYSQALSPLFGIVDSRGSYYLDANFNYELANTYTLNLHAGYQKVRGFNSRAASYQDYKITLNKTLGKANDWTLSLAAHHTNASQLFYSSPANGKFMGKNALVLSLTKSFK